VTIAESGERKSAADDEAIAPIREFEQQLEIAYDRGIGEFEISHAAWMKQRDQLLNDKTKSPKLHDKKAALRELGAPPVRPLLPMLLCSEPTIEGLFRLLREGRPSIGLFSDEGGQFIGGHAMSEENRLKTAAGLSSLWDGKPVRRTRQGEGAYVLRGRRVAMHLLVQPGVASRIFGDPVLSDQGVISRILAVQPEIAAGSRFWREVEQENFSRFSRFSAGLAAILKASLPLAEDKRNELQPRKLAISADGRALWTAFTDQVEALMAPNGAMEPIRALANKLGEHAARLAGILTLIEDLSATEISAEKLAAAIDLAQYYASEAIRIRETSAIGEELVTAERLLKWLHKGWGEEQSGNTLISLPDIYQFGPRPIHDRATAQKMVMLLMEHGWLVKADPASINGKHRREVWRIVRGE
jgi:hypothetical protein